jgi:hypothetical protein
MTQQIFLVEFPKEALCPWDTHGPVERAGYVVDGL